MNSNFVRTILNLLTGGSLLAILKDVAGCSTDAAGAATCTASWLPPQYAAIAGGIFVGLGLLLKMFGGSGATVAQNLAAPVVPVVAKADVKAGVVTADQVASTSPVK